jgi:hypothetical protein
MSIERDRVLEPEPRVVDRRALREEARVVRDVPERGSVAPEELAVFAVVDERHRILPVEACSGVVPILVHVWP